MEQIIERLIEARNASKLSLLDIQQRTKIPLRQLEYLESCQFDKIGPTVYTRGFIRRYAQEVGIDPDTLWEQESRQLAIPPSRASRRKKQPTPSNFAPFIRIGMIIALLAVVGFLIRAAVITYFEPPPPAPPDVPPGQDEPGPGEDPGNVEEPPVEDPEVVVELIQSDDLEAVYLVRNVEYIEVVLEYSGQCWTRIIADDVKILESTFRANDIQEVSDADVFRLRFGAPSFVSVTVNGVEIEVPNLKRAFNFELRLDKPSE